MGYYENFNDSIKIVNKVKEVDSYSLAMYILIIAVIVIAIYFFYLLFPKRLEDKIDRNNSLNEKRYIPYQDILNEVKKVRMLARKINESIKSNQKYNIEDLKEFKTYHDLIEDCLTKHHLIISENIRNIVHGLKTNILVFYEKVHKNSHATDIDKYFNSIEKTYQKVLKSTKKELGTLN